VVSGASKTEENESEFSLIKLNQNISLPEMLKRGMPGKD